MFQVPILALVLAVSRVVGALASRRLSPARVIGSTREDSSSAKLQCRFMVAVSVTSWFLKNRVVSPIQTPNLEDQWVLMTESPLRPQPGGPVSLMTESPLRPQPGGPVSLVTESPFRTVLVRGKPLLYEEDIHPIDQPGDAPTTPYSPSAGFG